MSEIKVRTLTDLSTSKRVDTSHLVRGTPKAWVTFNGETPAINENMNVSSLTDNKTGDYTLSLSNAMANATYCITSMGEHSRAFEMPTYFGSVSAHSFRVQSYQANNHFSDTKRGCSLIVGTLA